MPVENLTIPAAPEKTCTAAAAALTAALSAAQPYPTKTAQQRFEDVLCACIQGGACATAPPSVEGFLSFARELCDGIDREFSAPPAVPGSSA